MSTKTQNKNSQTGVLITNLGTPSSPTPPALRKYLAEFLWDPNVVQLPRILWWPLLHGIILPARSKKSAKLYQKIWTNQGSPLLALSTNLICKLQDTLEMQGLNYPLHLGMRYGDPSLRTALMDLQKAKVGELILVPLYPQYSTTTTASTIEKVNQELKALSWQPSLKVITNYATDLRYISALTQFIKQYWQNKNPGERLLFSFHGLPKKLITKGDPYFDQCQSTARMIAAELNLPAHRWQVVFQSRLGAAQWLQPYCDEVLRKLPKEGIKSVDIICPGFPVDCLETLEEIAMTNKELFLSAGGAQYNYIPALNSCELHLDFLANLIMTASNKIP